MNGPDFNTESNLHPDVVAERAASKEERAVDALKGLYGLLQLFSFRRDIGRQMGDWESNHRAEEARAVLELYGIKFSTKKEME